MTCNVAIKSRDSTLGSMLTKCWQIEEFPLQNTLRSYHGKSAETHFVKNVTVETDGRLMMRLPFKTSRTVLGQSFEMARRTFFSLETRLQRDTVLKKSYKEFLQEYTDLGHMSEI